MGDLFVEDAQIEIKTVLRGQSLDLVGRLVDPGVVGGSGGAGASAQGGWGLVVGSEAALFSPREEGTINGGPGQSLAMFSSSSRSSSKSAQKGMSAR